MENEIKVTPKRRVKKEGPPSVQEVLGISDMTKKFNTWWAKSFGVILAILLGILIGTFMNRGAILDDCKFNGVFRIGDQSFTCVRKM